MTFVVAGGIVRNRDWVLEDSIQALGSAGISKLYYLTGDNYDNTEQILKDNAIPYTRLDTGYENYLRGTYTSKIMGPLRNKWIKYALQRYPEATHLWSVDSDVIVPSGALGSLLSHDLDVVAGYVPVCNGAIPIHMFGWSDEQGHPVRTGEEKDATELSKCTLVGACVLMKREVLERCMPVYGEDGQGEDGFFAKRMREYGIQQWVDPSVKCVHRMEEPEWWKLKWCVQ